MLLLYDHNESVCCQKVRTALAEKRVAYQNRYVALEKGEQLSDEFLAINPNGVVPVLDHDGRIITESSIILEYIDEAFEGPALMPSDPYWRAVRRRWAKRIDDGMHVPHIAAISFIIAFSKAFRKNFDTEDKLQAYLDRVPLARARENLRESFHASLDSDRLRTSILAYERFLADMEGALERTAWLAGDAFSLADIDVAPYVWRLNSLQLSCMWAARPRVADWFARITARASWREAVVDYALPEWMALMQATGSEALPVVERILAEAA